MATRSTAKKNLIEIGDSGTRIFSGIIVGDEYRAELRGRQAIKIYDEMRRGDATVHAGLMAVKLPIIGVDWSVEAASDDDVDQQAADLLKFNLTQVLDWKARLSEMLTMLDFGFSVFELVFDVMQVNGVDRVVLTKLAYRKQTTIQRWEQEDGTPGIIQLTAKGELVSIPRWKLLVLTHQQEGDNYEGQSILRSAYQNWYFKKTFYQVDAIKHERQALGVVKIKYPNGADQTMREEARRAAANVRANEKAYLEQPTGWDIDFMDMKASTTSDPTESIAHHDRQILKNMAVQYLDIGASRSSGSRSSSGDQRALFEAQDQAIAEQIASAVNGQVAKALIDLNFTVSTYPKLRPGRIESSDVASLSDAVQKLAASEFLSPSDEDEEYLRSVLHFPEMAEGFKGRDRSQPPAALPAGDPAGSSSSDEPAAAEVNDLEDNLQASQIVQTAKQLHAAITEQLYGPPRAA